jgi:hypothetical protein
MTSIGFLPKGRLCLCLVLSTLFGSCSLFHDTAQHASERHALSMATITIYSPDSDEGRMMNALSLGVVHYINYSQIDWAPFHQSQVITVQLWVHNRQELDRVVNELESEGIVIKAVNYK